MERFLHFIWQNQLFSQLIPEGTLQGQAIEVLDVGQYNENAGADFFNAKIRIGDLIWVGNVEIHRLASEWTAHQHECDPAYNAVILHIVEQGGTDVFDSSGRQIPTCRILVPDTLASRASYLVEGSKYLPCLEQNPQWAGRDLSELFETLYRMRLQERVEQIETLWLSADRNFDECLYRLLMRYLGLGLNNDAMERLARSLPLRQLLWHRDDYRQMLALIWGQAGLLEGKLGDNELLSEYQFLAHKYSLSPLPKGTFRLARTRPANHPRQRLKQVVHMLQHGRLSVDAILRLSSIGDLRFLLEGDTTKDNHMSDEVLHILMINMVVPFMFFCAEALAQEELKGRAWQLIKDLNTEQNKIIRLFRRHHIKTKNALEGQALLQLYNKYCSTQGCLLCPLSHYMTKSEASSHKFF